jgi:hypothetical protein
VRLTEEEYAALTAKAPWRVPCKKPSKYRNHPTVVDGIRFDSRLEASRYQELKLLRASGAVLWFVLQTPFRLPGGITYKVDFLIVWNKGDRQWPIEHITLEDCKGIATRVSLNKIKQVEEIFGVTIEIIRKGKR